MGHRATLIKETKNGNYETLYSHWGAAAFNRLSDELYHDPGTEVDMETVNEQFNEIWERSIENNYETKLKTSMDEIVNPENISIESVILKTQDNEFHLGLTLINAEVNLTVFKQVEAPRDIQTIRQIRRTISSYARVAESDHKEPDEIREGIKNHLRSHRARSKCDAVVWPSTDVDKKLGSSMSVLI